MDIHLSVGLKIPDTTAITTFKTLKEMGFELSKVERFEHYTFSVTKDFEKFMENIVKVDVLVNANKHNALVSKEGHESKEDCMHVLVVPKEKDDSLLSLLKHSLGFDHIEKAQHARLWKLYGVDKETAENIASELLSNRHYEDFSVF